MTIKFQSTLPVWGATILMTKRLGSLIFQSTLPVWGATLLRIGCSPILEFQSTLPVWGATKMLICTIPTSSHFNPRSPCGERPEADVLLYRH